jgi:hypothetical protein
MVVMVMGRKAQLGLFDQGPEYTPEAVTIPA